MQKQASNFRKKKKEKKTLQKYRCAAVYLQQGEQYFPATAAHYAAYHYNATDHAPLWTI